MKGWSFDVATVWGIRIRIHATFFLLLVWVGWLGYDWAGLSGLLWSVGLIATVFTCVVLHELGHCWMALRFGVPVDAITLLPVGGVAHMRRMPEKPSQEFLIALAGPMVNVVIAGVLLLFRGWPAPIDDLPSSWGTYLDYVLRANLFLVAFNMIPAFPMDGGRLLRSALAWRMSYAGATRIAAGIGRTLALVLVAAGFLVNPFLVLIGLVVFWGAGVEDRMVEARSRLGGRNVASAMEAPRCVVHVGQTLRDCLRLCHVTGEADFGVVDGARLVGWLPEDLWRVEVDRGMVDRPVEDVMLTRFVAVRPDMPMEAVVEDAARFRRKSVPVVVDGILLGVLRLDATQDAAIPSPPPIETPRRGGWRMDLG